MNGVVFVLAASALFAQAPAPAVVAMEDQFEHPQNTAAFLGDVVVLIYGDRDGAEANRALGERLHVAFHPSAKGLPPTKARQAPVRPLPDLPPDARSPDVRTVAVACVGKVGPVVRAVVRTSIRAASPDVPVWLDFGDAMRKQFPFTAGAPNVVVLDAAGRPRYTASGRLTEEQIARMLDDIEGLRREAAAGTR